VGVSSSPRAAVAAAGRKDKKKSVVDKAVISGSSSLEPGLTKSEVLSRNLKSKSTSSARLN
jgi:hypothetical protein